MDSTAVACVPRYESGAAGRPNRSRTGTQLHRELGHACGQGGLPNAQWKHNQLSEVSHVHADRLR